MPTSNCPHCNTDHDWDWEQAFYKFGFDDGDGLVKTDVVAAVLTAAGYVVKTQTWGMHNTIVTSIRLNGEEKIPKSAELGYDIPRSYLPEALVTLLDEADWDNAEATLGATDTTVSA